MTTGKPLPLIYNSKYYILCNLRNSLAITTVAEQQVLATIMETENVLHRTGKYNVRQNDIVHYPGRVDVE